MCIAYQNNHCNPTYIITIVYIPILQCIVYSLGYITYPLDSVTS